MLTQRPRLGEEILRPRRSTLTHIELPLSYPPVSGRQRMKGLFKNSIQAAQFEFMALATP